MIIDPEIYGADRDQPGQMDGYEPPYHDFNGITSKCGATFILRVDKILMKEKYYNAIINGVPDWVYEEEFSMSRAMEFSADSKMLAFIRYDESKVPTYSFPLFAGASPKYNEYAKYPGAYTYKYPKTGEANSKVEVRTFDIQSKVTRTMQVPLEEGAYIPRIYFTKQPDQLAIITMNRHQNRLDMYMGNARSTVCKLVLRDESDTYIKEEVLDDIRFYDNNFTK